MGKPLSTAFENLPLILSLEETSGRQTILIAIAGPANQDGRTREGDGWGYTFAEMSGGTRKLYGWIVRGDGRVEFRGEVLDLLRYERADIGPFLQIDSPQAARLGREYGAQPFVDRYPNAQIGMSCRFLGGQPIWDLGFFVIPGPTPFCEPNIWLHAQTGQLMARDVSCISRLP
jgi:hypothetical protein